MIKIPELLSPAGSMEHLKAAAQNGADAVYFGGEFLNARQSAANFTLEEIKEAVEYTKLRDVRSYVTVNTLLNNEEVEDAITYGEKLSAAGVDALILADLGLVAAMRVALPEMELHYSTQGTIYNSAGVKMAKKLGISRVVLARELSFQQIAEITSEQDIETEVFIHGALCMSYSGQCLMSSVIGGRSGNRGTCAQPCRLPYRLVDDENHILPAESKYLMSPKDLCMINDLEKLCGIGVNSLKIEGRLKSPEYTALVTGLYRKYLDDIRDRNPLGESGITQKEKKLDKKKLLQVFNRGGFTSGYFLGKPESNLLSGERSKHEGLYIGVVEGYDPKKKLVETTLEDKLSIGDGIEIVNETLPGNVVTYIKTKHKVEKSAGRGEKVFFGDITGKMEKGDAIYKITDKLLMRELRETFATDFQKKLKVKGNFTAKLDQVIHLELKDEQGNIGVGVGQLKAEKAIQVPLTEQKIRQQLEKTGNTIVEMSTCNIALEAGISIPLSEINKVRRDAVEDFVKCKKKQGEQQISKRFYDVHWKEKMVKSMKTEVALQKEKKKLALYFYEWSSKLEEIALLSERVYLCYDQLLAAEKENDGFLNRLKRNGTQVIAVFPCVSVGFHDENIKAFLKERDVVSKIYGISIGNVGQLALLEGYEGKIYAEASLNILNHFSVLALKKQGVDGMVLSHEIQNEAWSEIKDFGNELEAVVYGRIPVMTTEYCPLAGAGGMRQPNCHICGENKGFALKDRTGTCYPILLDKSSCRATILHSESECKFERMRRMKESHVSVYRMCIYDESKEVIKAQIRNIRKWME